MQAFALQHIVEDAGYNIEIINYRTVEQKNSYAMYRTKYGVKVLIKDLMQLPSHFKRRQRRNKYEKFIEQFMITSEELQTPDDVYRMWSKYSVIISGSDQIWSKNSNELKYAPWENMYPYLLVGYEGKKISYASSLGSMSEEQISKIIPYVSEFDAVSFREKSRADVVSKMLNKEVTTVVDPTLLLSKADWINILGIKEENGIPYILYYSLHGIKGQKSTISFLTNIAKKNGMRLRVVTPFVQMYFLGNTVDRETGYGPIDIVSSIYNAEIVVTDSYHGTLFSLNMEKNFYSICDDGGSAYRKTEILNALGLDSRIIRSVEEIPTTLTDINYDDVRSTLKLKKNASREYIVSAIQTLA